MANEIEIAELPIKLIRGNVQIYKLDHVVSQQIDASATQDDSAAFNDDVVMIRVENTGATATRIAVWDTAGTVDATNSVLLSAGQIMDIQVQPGQILSSKVV